MHCPVDGEELVITDRSGVEIDYCPKCRGVWLDRGELDKIIDRSDRTKPSHEAHASRDTRGGKRKKRGGIGDFLEDIFDF
ncbi:zf-TFIIB domain-containing protein [Roseovarius sp. MMSF_3281]|uniref:TFIIB-type zinc ribbon-containing protein n=1 Tax=Roseovarius sp. MMSF_3281 TaxID=3046694 RepID=UPI00273E5052|nr:zf-TFIIB domain-containing protein [Roseovarius sp. MMSF_3281]